MDYLDPEKQRRHNIMLLFGYVLIGLGVLAITWLLFYTAYGYGRGKNGQIILNGLVYISSQPHPATMTINGKVAKSQTNTRLLLPSGQYNVKLSRTGYRDWQRALTIEGGDVQHFDYPVLFPKTLTTTPLHSYAAAPGMATQSPDQRWVLVQQANSQTSFDVYDLKDPTKAPATISLPANLLSGGANQSWQAVQWSNDNIHVLLNHIHDGANEFIVVDRQTPAQSVNLNKTFSANPTAVSLIDRKYDQYYLYDAAKQTLQTATLKPPQVTPYLEGVLAYKSYTNDTVLYATSSNAPAGKTAINMRVGSRTYHIRDVAAATTYPLDLTQYNGTLYVVVASSGDSKIYIYKDPAGQLNTHPTRPAAPLRALLLSQPTFVSFSANTQFIMAEAGDALSVYDLQNSKNYRYSVPDPIDAPQTHLTWMDGDRMVYASNGTLKVMDYDEANAQALMPASPSYVPFFAPDFKHVFALAPVNGQPNVALTETALVTPADL